MEAVGDGVAASVDGTMDRSGLLRLSIAGELDIASVDGVKDAIKKLFIGNPRGVVFDLEQLTFMDSSGIALMLQMSRRVEAVEVLHATPIVRRASKRPG